MNSNTKASATRKAKLVFSKVIKKCKKTCQSHNSPRTFSESNLPQQHPTQNTVNVLFANYHQHLPTTLLPQVARQAPRTHRAQTSSTRRLR